MQSDLCDARTSINHSLNHSLTHSLARLLAPSLPPSVTHSLTHALTHSRTHALSQSRTHALTHLRTHAFYNCSWLGARPLQTQRVNCFLSVTLALFHCPPHHRFIEFYTSHGFLHTSADFPFPVSRFQMCPWNTWSHQYPIAPWRATSAPCVHCILNCVMVICCLPPLAVNTCFVPSLSRSPPARPIFLSLRILGCWFALRWTPPSLSMVCLSAFCTAWFDFLFLGDFYLPHPPDSTQQGISFSTLGPLTTNSIPMPCCSPPSLASPIVFAQMFRHRSRAPSCIQFFPLPPRTLPLRCNWTPPHHRRVGWSRREHC